MKRLVFFVAALFAVCMSAMAQPNASIYSFGSDNQATIRQSHNPNTAKIVQDWGRAFENKATILQCCPRGAYNTAEIWQADERNEAKVTQGGGMYNLAVVWQAGEANKVELMQGGGNGNWANVKQEVGTFMNHVDFVQWGTSLKADIYQKGNFNDVKLMQGGNGGVIDIDQLGDGNEIYGIACDFRCPDKPYGYFAGASLDVLQQGHENTLRLYSNAPGGVVDVDQIGCGNMATVLQTDKGLCCPEPPYICTPNCCPYIPNGPGGPR